MILGQILSRRSGKRWLGIAFINLFILIMTIFFYTLVIGLLYLEIDMHSFLPMLKIKSHRHDRARLFPLGIYLFLILFHFIIILLAPFLNTISI